MISRVVLDTNVYVSALLFGGKPKQVLDLALNGSLRLLISEQLKLEMERILRDKFDFTARKIAESAELLWSDAEWIDPKFCLNICPDESDNRVLECALEGKAGYIVSGDRHLLSLQPIEGLAILLPSTFLERFHATGAAF
jgi:putative PIN family toxin of toxin-antitoxin system